MDGKQIGVRLDATLLARIQKEQEQASEAAGVPVQESAIVRALLVEALDARDARREPPKRGRKG